MDLRRLRRIQNQRTEWPAYMPRWRRGRDVPHHSGDETAQVSVLLTQLAKDKRRLNPPPSLTFLMAAAIGLYVVSLLANGTVFWNGLIVISVSLLALNTFVVVVLNFARFKARASVLRQLTGYDDMRVIEPLIQALYIPDHSLRYAARIALTRLLPRLQASDPEISVLPQSRRLCRQLTLREAARMPDFVCAVLNACVQIDDVGAMPGVQRLAMRKTRTAAQRRIQQAALDSLLLRTLDDHA